MNETFMQGDVKELYMPFGRRKKKESSHLLSALLFTVTFIHCISAFKDGIYVRCDDDMFCIQRHWASDLNWKELSDTVP